MTEGQTRRIAERLIQMLRSRGFTSRAIDVGTAPVGLHTDGFFKRLVLRSIAKREGASIDTSRDHEYTNWSAVERLSREMTDAVRYHADIVPLSV
jgi:menaquinone-dependent protoporphyrinogen IX oxidase